MYDMYGICDSPGNLQITDATVADLCHTLKTPWGDLAVEKTAFSCGCTVYPLVMSK